MRGFVANTDFAWYAHLRSLSPLGEANLWRSSSEVFRSLKPGEPLFFKLKAPHQAIAGFGIFAHYSVLPVSLGWEIYGEANGVGSAKELLAKARQLRADDADGKHDPDLGAILVHYVELFQENDWIDPPNDFETSAGYGKVYDLGSGEGERIWNQCMMLAGRSAPDQLRDGLVASRFFGRPLGPRSFRVAVLDAYGRRCAVTGTDALTALDAVRIRDLGDPGAYSISNGIAMRADLCRLFSGGYLGIDKDLRLRVSRALAASERSSYAELDGARITVPRSRRLRPSAAALWWHHENRFHD